MSRRSEPGRPPRWVFRTHPLQVMAASELADLLADPGSARGGLATGPPGAPVARIGQHGGEQACLACREVGCAGAEMMPRRRFGAEDADAPFHAVEVDLENALLWPQQFDQGGEPGFQALPGPAAARPEKQVLRHLLA